MNCTTQKKQIRHHLLRQLQMVSAHDRETASAALRAEIAQRYLQKEPLTVGIYLPLPHEVDLVPLIQQYPQHRFAAPRCLPGRILEFRHITHVQTDTELAAHGIAAPKTICPVIGPDEFDLILVPGVGFTQQGARLGYGGGYYDRYLLRCRHAIIAAAVFSQQLVTTLPTEDHDLTIPNIMSVSL